MFEWWLYMAVGVLGGYALFEAVQGLREVHEVIAQSIEDWADREVDLDTE